MTSTGKSHWSHEQSKSWHLRKDGEALDIYLDILSDREIEQTQARLDEAQALIDEHFK